MNLYLAAPRERAAEMAAVAEQLRDLGHELTARWIRGFHGPDGEWAVCDLTDILAADALILFTENLPKRVRFSSRGDRHVAFGYALKAARMLFVVGPRESLFHQLPQVLRFDNSEEMLRYFAQLGGDNGAADQCGR